MTANPESVTSFTVNLVVVSSLYRDNGAVISLAELDDMMRRGILKFKLAEMGYQADRPTIIATAKLEGA